MKQCLKYTVVVCSFMLVAGLFFPSVADKVKASDTGTEITVPSDNVESWVVTIQYVVDGGVTETVVPVSSGGLFGFTIASAPEKAGSVFQGWLCSVTGDNVTDSGSLNGSTFNPNEMVDTGYVYNCTDYNGATITLTAQWTGGTSGDGSGGGDTSGETTTPPDTAEGVSVTDTGTYSLTTGIQYKLEAGTWTVDNGSDGCQYAGGSSFYVKESRDYSFTKN